MFLASLVGLGACAVAFSPGTGSAPPPEGFEDIDDAPPREEQKREEVAVSTSPTFGLSLVVGGRPLDAGGIPIPKPPFPVVLPP